MNKLSELLLVIVVISFSGVFLYFFLDWLWNYIGKVLAKKENNQSHD